eukprot:m.99694 g.99694  ORF g.99694 m.99694 type:complete len:562 (-) comp8728_c0_seq1:103-1788(-)
MEGLSGARVDNVPVVGPTSTRWLWVTLWVADICVRMILYAALVLFVCPGYGFTQLIIFHRFMSTAEREEVLNVEVYTLCTLGIVMHIPYLCVLSSGVWENSFWGFMWYTAWTHPRQKIRELWGQPMRYKNKQEWLASAIARKRDAYPRMDCSILRRVKVEKYVTTIFGFAHPDDGYFRQDGWLVAVVGDNVSYYMLCCYIPVAVVVVLLFAIIPFLVRFQETEGLTFNELYSSASNAHRVIVALNCLQGFYILNQEAFIWAAVERLFHWMDKGIAQFTGHHIVNSIEALDYWLMHFECLQNFLKHVVRNCRVGILYLIIVDLLISVTLLIRTYTSSQLKTSEFWLFLLVTAVFFNAQIIRLIQVIARLGDRMNACVSDLRADQITLIREFRRMNYTPEGTTLSGEISTRHRHFLESIALPSQRADPNGAQPRERDMDLHLSDEDSELFERRASPMAPHLHDESSADGPPHPAGQAQASRVRAYRRSRKQADQVSIAVVPLCSSDNETVELTPFRLAEIAFIADALRDQAIEVFGVHVTTGLLTTVVSLAGTNLASIVSQII